VSFRSFDVSIENIETQYRLYDHLKPPDEVNQLIDDFLMKKGIQLNNDELDKWLNIVDLTRQQSVHINS
jgi:hypothetical protein